jgi:hypothetical protein
MTTLLRYATALNGLTCLWLAAYGTLWRYSADWPLRIGLVVIGVGTLAYLVATTRRVTLLFDDYRDWRWRRKHTYARWQQRNPSVTELLAPERRCSCDYGYEGVSFFHAPSCPMRLRNPALKK